MIPQYLDIEDAADDEGIDFSGEHPGTMHIPHHLKAQVSSSTNLPVPDLREQYEVRLEEGLDAFVVVDGLPQVTSALKPKLVKFLLKRLCEVGRTSSEAIFMPLNSETEKTEGYAVTPERPHCTF